MERIPEKDLERGEPFTPNVSKTRMYIGIAIAAAVVIGIALVILFK